MSEKPCPFCGSVHVVVTEAPPVIGCYVICHNCGATGPKTAYSSRAMELWERAPRAVLAQIPSQEKP